MDIMQIEILEDGTISVKTDLVSKVNHSSADALLEMLENELGGTRTTTSRKDKETHSHHHHHIHKHIKIGA